MITRKPEKTWFPFWADKWIWGSIRIEFSLEERAIWIDLLAMASKDGGYIRANEDIPYPMEQLAGTLIIPVKKLEAAIDKFIEKGKLIKEKNGTLLVAKWEKYQFSESYARVTKHRQKTPVSNGKPLQCNKKALPYNRIEENKIEHNKKEGHTVNINAEQEMQITKQLMGVKNLANNKIGMVIRYIRELSWEFPDIDYVEEMKKKIAWWRDNPLTKKSNIHLQLRNWFIIAQKGIDEARRQHSVGAPRGTHKTKYPLAFIASIYAALHKQGKDGHKYADLLFALTDAEAKAAAEKYKNNPAGFIKFLETDAKE